MASERNEVDVSAQFEAVVKKYLHVSMKPKKNQRQRKIPRITNDQYSNDWEEVLRCLVTIQQPLNCDPVSETTILSVLETTCSCFDVVYDIAPKILQQDGPERPSFDNPASILSIAEKNPIYGLLLDNLQNVFLSVLCPSSPDQYAKCMEAMILWINDRPHLQWLLYYVAQMTPNETIQYSLQYLATEKVDTNNPILRNLDEYLALEYSTQFQYAIQTFLDEIITTSSVNSLVNLLNVSVLMPHCIQVCDVYFNEIFNPKRVLSLVRLSSTTELTFQTLLIDILKKFEEKLIQTPRNIILLLDQMMLQDSNELLDGFTHEILECIRTRQLFSLEQLVYSLPFLLQEFPTSKWMVEYLQAILTASIDNKEILEKIWETIFRQDMDETHAKKWVDILPNGPACMDFIASKLTSSNSTNHEKKTALLFMKLLVKNSKENEEMDQSMSERWKHIDIINRSMGLDHWFSILNIVLDEDRNFSLLILELLSDMPYPILEDPIWQYNCLYKLLDIFFFLLEDCSSDPIAENCLNYIIHLLGRILNESGGVVSFPASVVSTFLTLIIDGILSATSCTTIPNHIPDEMNFFKGKKIINDTTHVFRKLSATNCLLPYTPFNKIKKNKKNKNLIIFQLYHLKKNQKKLFTPSIYEKELYEIRLNEMNNALNNSKYIEIMIQKIFQYNSIQFGNLFTETLLERIIPISIFIPSDELYREFLPERSNHDIDLRIEQWLYRYPLFLPLVRYAVLYSTSIVSYRCLPILKSILVVLMNYWHAHRHDTNNNGLQPYYDTKYQLHLSIQFMSILNEINWLPEPLGSCGLLFQYITSMDRRALLHGVWMYLCDHPPNKNIKDGIIMDIYNIPIQNAIHRNIHSIGDLYGRFL